MPERGCVVLDQPQPLGTFQRFCVFHRLRLSWTQPRSILKHALRFSRPFGTDFFGIHSRQ
jgi:hypothetical protein